jgi:hypothetical protein
MLWVDNTSWPWEIIKDYLIDGDVIENIFYLRSPSRIGWQLMDKHTIFVFFEEKIPKPFSSYLNIARKILKRDNKQKENSYINLYNN